MEVSDKNQKNNFYCRYLDENGKTFALTKHIPAENVSYIHKEFWKYDSTDHIWECVPTATKQDERISQCAFSIK